MPVLIHPWRSHHQYHLVAGGDDLLNLCPQPQVRLAAQRLFQLPAAMAGPRLRICEARIEVGPFQVRIHQIHHPRDFAPVVGQECLADDPLVQVAHLESLATVMSQSGARVGASHYHPAITTTASRLRSESSMNPCLAGQQARLSKLPPVRAPGLAATSPMATKPRD